MPTPLMPDEEFDALFRQGLEHHPELPEIPAAWHRMDLLLDADLRQQALRRKVLRMLGAESVLLLVLLWGAWFFVGGLPDSAPASGQALAGLPRPAGAIVAAAPTTAPGNRMPQTASATYSASLAEPAWPPTRRPGEQAALAAKTGAITSGKEPVPATRTPLATAAAVGSRQTSSAGRLPAAGASATRHQHNGRPLAPSRAATAAQSAFSTSTQRPKTRHQAIATAARAAERPPATLFRRDAQAGLVASSAYANAASGSRNGQAQSAVKHRQPRRQLATATRHWPSPRRARQATNAAGLAAAETDFGTAIALLAPRGPKNDLAFARPDSLRPVALAARVLPTDSLTPPLLRPQPYRLQLGLVAAPELSTVRTSRLSPPGPSVGVQLDYQLAQRWHLSTAFLYSVKRYAAAGSDYTVPYSLPHGWVITDVEAVCRIIDIPLNLRYDLWQQPRYQVFASAGLSSLFMKREQYTYEYGLVYGKPVAPYTFELANGSQHLLKVLNLSVGYERLLGRRWSVQAEPFVKLPLAGVGYGAVRLRSAGVFFSLRYGLLPGRPAPPPARQ